MFMCSSIQAILAITVFIAVASFIEAGTVEFNAFRFVA
jgi:hypothetical protein